MGTQSGKPYLYEKIVHRYSVLIENGTLEPGDRLPSVRELRAKEKLSPATVLQAYGVLQDLGLVEARPQSGYYVRFRPQELPPEPSPSRPALSASRVTVAELVLQVQRAVADPEMVPFGAACPSPELLPVKKLNRTLASLLHRAQRQGNSYEVPEGNLELRRQIARRGIERGLRLSADDVVTTFGCTEAVNLCLRAVAEPGDAILVESPTYYGALQIIESLGMKAVEVATHPREGLDLDALKAVLRKNRVKACFLMPNVHNPLGSSMPEANKKELVELLARRRIPLIEDDIYGDLYYGPRRPRSVKAYDEDDLVLVCDSFSKTLSPGYRVGWTAPGRFKKRVQELKLTSTITTTTLPQMTIAEVLKSGGYDRYLRKIRQSYARNVQLAGRAISRHFPEGTRVTRPLGGFILWVELPHAIDAMSLYRKALEKKIGIVPGQLFSAQRRYRSFIRVSCGHPWSERLEQGLRELGRLAEREASRRPAVSSRRAGS